MEILNVNTNKLHDELIASGIRPKLVESIGNKTFITFEEETNMELVQRIIHAHDPTLVSQFTQLEKLEQENMEIKLALAELAESIFGGV